MQPAYWKRLYLASRKVTCPLEAAYKDESTFIIKGRKAKIEG